MEAARNLVATAAKFAAGVEHRKHGLQGRLARAGMDIGGNAAAVVGDRGGAVGTETYKDFVAVAGEGLINGVIHHLIHKVMQTPGTGGADVHARALAHRLKPLKDLNLIGAVFRLHLGGGTGRFAHY